MYDIHKIKLDIDILHSIIENEKNKTFARNSKKSSYKIYSMWNYKKSDNKYFFLTKINDIFKIDEIKHIVDFEKMIDGIQNLATFYDTEENKEEIIVQFINEIKGISYEIKETVNEFDDYKNKNKDKLIFNCPKNNEDFCPVCSFTNALKLLNFHPNIVYNDINHDNYNKFVLNRILSEFFDIFTGSMYPINNYFIPAIVYDINSDEIEESMLRVNDNELKDLSNQTKDILDEKDKDSEYIEEIILTVQEIDDELKIVVKEINIGNFKELDHTVITKVDNNINKYKHSNIDSLKNIIFSGTYNTVSDIQNKFDFLTIDIPTKIKESINKIINSEVI